MTIDNKGFTNNTVDTPAPWGATEVQCIKDIQDTLVLDTISGAKDTTSGHKHAKFYSEAHPTTPVIDCTDSAGDVIISPYVGGKCRIDNTETGSSYANTVCYFYTESNGADVHIASDAPNFNIQNNNSGGSVAITSGGVSVTVSANTNKTVIATGTFQMSLPSSSAGLTSNEWYKDGSGFVKVVP